MSSILPSPIPPATQTVRGTMSAADKLKLDGIPDGGGGGGAVTAVTEANGLDLDAGTLSLGAAGTGAAGAVTSGTQNIDGAKTFLSSLTAAVEVVTNLVRAVAASLVLRSSLGAGASDECVVVGTSEADGTVNASAKVWVAATGIGGTKINKVWVDKAGNIRTGGAAGLGGDFRGQSTSAGFCRVNDSTGSHLRYSNCDLQITGSGWSFFNHSLAGVAFMQASGRFDRYGTDSTASPGATTIARPTGKSAIAAGASSVVITNSLVTAASRVMITPHARDTTCKELIAVPAAGSFTVSGTANATAALPFSWEVSNII